MTSRIPSHNFSFASHDRAAHLRKSAVLDDVARSNHARFILFHGDQPVFFERTDKMLCVHWFTRQELLALLKCTGQSEEELICSNRCIFLGTRTRCSSDGNSPPSREAVDKAEAIDSVGHCGPQFAISVPASCELPFPEDGEQSIAPRQLRAAAGRMESGGEGAVVACAKSVFEWHRNAPFCSLCGSANRIVEWGHRLHCLNEACVTNSAVVNVSHPRTDPVVIFVIESPDGQQVLLGRGPRHPGRMYSCLAGFIEPGETVEHAVVREAFEESGVIVDLASIRYAASQPWPFPGSLMLGFTCRAQTTDIVVDPEELLDALWASKDDVARALEAARQPGTPAADGLPFLLPPPLALAHTLLQNWVSRGSL